jgi:hypothetical protein
LAKGNEKVAKTIFVFSLPAARPDVGLPDGERVGGAEDGLRPLRRLLALSNHPTHRGRPMAFITGSVTQGEAIRAQRITQR